jgi:hypothetical protein
VRGRGWNHMRGGWSVSNAARVLCRAHASPFVFSRPTLFPYLASRPGARVRPRRVDVAVLCAHGEDGGVAGTEEGGSRRQRQVCSGPSWEGGTLSLFAPLCASLSPAACPSGGVHSLADGRRTAQGVMGKPVRGLQAWRDGQARAFGRRLCTCWETEFDGKAVVKPGAWASAPFAHTLTFPKEPPRSLCPLLSPCAGRAHIPKHTHTRTIFRARLRSLVNPASL